MPPALAFLVANFHSLVTIKLDTGTDNYLLWKTQVVNATRANGFLQYIDGSVVCPPKEIMNSSNTLVTNDAYLKWILIDNQLLSCLTSSLSASTLSLVMGLEHSSEVWSCLEQRFNSMSRSNLHDLKRELFNFSYKKSGNLNTYIDDIKICAQKLGAVGYIVDDDDMIFHTLNGLPTEYDPLKQTIRAQRDLRFYEVVTILKGEEKTIHKEKVDEGSNSVLLATQKVQDLNIRGASSSSNSGSLLGTPPFAHQTPSGFQVHTPLYSSPSPGGSVISPQFVSGPFFSQSPQGYQMFLPPQLFPQAQGNSGNRFNGNNRFKPKGQNFGSKVECQICGKTNHSAKTCYYRNTDTPFFGQNFQSFPRHPPPVWKPQQSFFNEKGGSSQNQSPRVHYTVTGPSSSVSGYDTGFHGLNSGFGGDFSSQGYPQPTAFSAIPSPGFQSMSQVPIFTASSSAASNSGLGQGTQSQSPQNWYFDSGATNHVTSDVTTLTHAQPYAGGAGQSFTSNPSHGTLPSGTLSYPELL